MDAKTAQDLAQRLGLVEKLPLSGPAQWKWSSLDHEDDDETKLAPIPLEPEIVAPKLTFSARESTFVSSHPPTTPSILLKAYAIALRAFLTTETDLSIPDQAIFVATLQEKGVPLDCAPEYANEALYWKSDPIQNGSSLAFSATGAEASFFSYLRGYVASVTDLQNQDTTLTSDQKKYIDARRDADDAYHVLWQSFQDKLVIDPAYHWQTHYEHFGMEYQARCAIRDLAGSVLKPTDWVKTMQGFDAAQARRDEHQGNTMRCSLDSFQLDKRSRYDVNEASVRNRPLHVLPNFESAALPWRLPFKKELADPQKVELDLKRAHMSTWSSLGFPQFDDSSPVATPEEIESFVSQCGCHIWLTYTHIVPFRVARGLWDIPDFRDVLKQLRADVDPKFKKKVHKTVTLLLGYGVQIRMQLDASAVGLNENEIKLAPGLFEGVSMATVSATEKRTPVPENDAYPVLLAVLTQKC
ncbi:hypothetical protein SLS60_001421 [Paraconiothyrium brasiliense]|uniref:Uncharacterized protein n=1 Tax=Paraconiothyrium brasiliense TaxID=300254 RepID=A0ABR3S905_9PLEO